MTYTVLVPYDGSEQSERAIDHVVEHFDDVDVIVLSIINPAESVYATGDGAVSPFPDNWYETAQQQAEEMLESATEQVEAGGLTAKAVVEVGRPGRAIVDYVEEHDIDHVVMGSHGRSGMTRILLGSVAETVIRRSPVPVTVIR